MGKKFRDTVPIPCSPCIVPPSSDLLASPFLASIFAGAISHLKITMLHTHMYFFLLGSQLIACGNSSAGRANLPVRSARQQLDIQLLVTPRLWVQHPQPHLHHLCFPRGYGLGNTHSVTALHPNNNKMNKKEENNKRG